MSACGLRALRGAMEGIAASLLCTCDVEGQPNVSMISQVHWVDDEHVAPPWQFFNKTRANLLATGKACVELFDPVTHSRHRPHLDHVETRNEGPLYEMMKARLAGIASHHGLEGVFRLLGADIFRVTGIEQLTPASAVPEADRPPYLSAVRFCIDALAQCRDFDELADAVLDGVVLHLRIPMSSC
ncbi:MULTISPECIES: pyridoxamine 5'-phosphate oxidase family protein [unclassified Paracoccus (in: a-proteobacteria)]|uniref:pyridoxamine 5'-phosphate oxidase family protein n=1 Tax=unclassified Paracoccus (in: a-proteobacteria) TaxID=2688777 RepID=UPI0021E167D9|nr:MULTISPECIES: pyridoxamine 5'-phosphate oxidase family protein [unclassified Paracoccus (in: a-proteobacteria)]UXU74403.1 pyridoxamine 5'-phosphate oxidase family protein [Paracoccus sp. SMMA_5]UXU80293.1 pyridoxamine 5'-phosphate oxidase family protein [Paracoccus sp. SMMA_5_TC]